MAGQKIKAVIFDLGGVLFTDGATICPQRLEKEYGYDFDIVKELLRSPESLDLRKGMMKDDEFWKWAQKQLPDGYNAMVIRDAWHAAYELDQNILNLMKKLRGKYKVVAFSGNIPARVDFLEKKYDFLKHFDKTFFSFDYHLGKNDPAFTDKIIEELGFAPDELVYIDDQESKVGRAREKGVNVLIYTTGEIEDLTQGLRKLGVEC